MKLCCKVTSLLFNMLARFVNAFLPTNKHLLISWLQSPSTVILEPRKIKSATLIKRLFSSSAFCPKSEIIWASEVIISPGNDKIPMERQLFFFISCISCFSSFPAFFLKTRLVKAQYLDCSFHSWRVPNVCEQVLVVESCVKQQPEEHRLSICSGHSLAGSGTRNEA